MNYNSLRTKIESLYEGDSADLLLCTLFYNLSDQICYRQKALRNFFLLKIWGKNLISDILVKGRRKNKSNLIGCGSHPCGILFCVN